jgi:PAS domain S-box-containing protein
MSTHRIKSLDGNKALRASELSYRRLFEAAQDGILILDVKTGRIMDVNPFLIKLLGFSHREVVGKTVGELSPFKDVVTNQAMLERLQKNGYVRYDDLPLETKNGRHISVEFVSNVYQAGNKKVIQCNIRDITERKRSDERLNLLNTCLSNLNDIVLVMEADPIDEPGPRIVFVNAAFERITGYTSTEVLGRSPRFLEGKKTDRRVLAEMHQAMKKRKSIRRQLVHYRKDGSEYWVDIDLVPIFNAEGKCTHFATIKRDITEEKKIEAQLLWKTAFFEAQVNSALDAIIVVDSEGKKLLENPQMLDLWHAPTEIYEDIDHRRRLEWVGRQVKNPRQFAEKVAYLYAHPKEVSRDELELKNGKFFDRYTAPVRGQDGKYFGRIWAYRDITERKKSEARFRRLVDSNAQGVFFWNTKGEISGANDAFLRIIRCTREDVEAGRVDWKAMTPPEYANLDRRALEAIAATGTCAPYEKEYILKDGSRVPILLGSASFEDNPNEGVSFALDLTDRNKLEQQFLRSQRMESIGTLASGIAHDLNNILAPIMMSIHLLKDLSKDPEAKDILETIELSAKRGGDIVRQVLSFARGLEGERIELQPRNLITDIKSIIKDTFPKNIRLHFSVPNKTWSILGDPTQLHQILLNLSVNARDAMSTGGNLTIGVENCVLDKHYAAMHIEAKAGRYVKISVTDSGTGISPDIVDKIFEPFFTTKGLGQGTGLGLSTVMAIVKSHDGFVNVYSEPGKGTTFKAYLPAMSSYPRGKKKPQLKATVVRGSGETILVVDDEASIITITSRTLQAFGYKVMTAADGADAVATYLQNKKKIAVVLTDMSMPIMDGAAVIHALTKINPNIKIIATSGLNTNVGLAKGIRSKVKHFLTKPYVAETLLKTIRTILDEA